MLTRALGRCRVWAVECEGGTLSATGDRAERRKESVEPGAWVQTAEGEKDVACWYECVRVLCVVCTTVRSKVEGCCSVREHCCCYYRSRGGQQTGGRTGKARPH